MSPAVVLATFSGALMIADLVVAKSARDTLFLSNFSAAALPAAMIVTAGVSLPAVFGGSALMTRIGPHRFLPAFLVLNALAFVAEWLAVPEFPRAMAAVIYVHVGLFGGLSISAFWSVVNERFDPHSARRTFSTIAFGFALGGLFGGLLAERMSAWFDVRAMLLALAPLNLVGAVCVAGIGAPEARSDSVGESTSGLRILASSAYLKALALLVVLVAMGAAALDYSFKSSVAAALGEPARLAEFFAVYYTVTSVATVVLQGTASRHVLDRYGLGVTLAVLPAALLVGGAASLLVGGLATIVLLRGAEAVLANSFFRSAYEPLYTPLPPGQKRATKAIIVVASDRFGDALGSLGILLVLWAAPAHVWPVSLGIVLSAAAVLLWLARRLQRGYVAELATSLRTGLVRISEHEIADATTRLTLSQTHGQLDRETLLREIASARKRLSPAPELAATAVELASGDAERIHRALAARPLDPRLVSFVVPLIEYDELRGAALKALAAVAPHAVGQLADAMLERELPDKARWRIPALLANAADSRAVRALTQGLSDPDFDLRERCARALLSLHRRDPALRPPNALVLSAVESELQVPPSVWRSRSATRRADDPGLAELAGLRKDRSLQHVFTLLCLILDPESLELALRALDADDPKLRGTALEFLDNVIPSEVKLLLWPHLAGKAPGRSTALRSNHELTQELKRSLSG